MQTVEFIADPGQTLAAKLFAMGSDTVTATASSVAEATNRSGTYIASFSGAADGQYKIVATASDIAKATWFVDIVGDAAFIAYELTKAPPTTAEIVTAIKADAVLGAVETKAQADTRQATLITEHDATQTAVAAISSGGGLTDQNVTDIVDGVTVGVTKVTPRIRDASAGSYSMIAGDTWTQTISLTASGADKYAVSIKSKDADSDDGAILYADSATGLIRLNGAAAVTASQASITYSSGVLTITISSLATKLIPAADYFLTAKSLDVGADKSHENNADLTVTNSGVDETSAS